MKRVLLGLLLIFYTTIFAQNLYKISFENFSYIMDQRTRSGSVNSKIHVYVNYTDGTQDVLYDHDLPNKGRHNEYDYNHTVHTSKNLLISVIIFLLIGKEMVQQVLIVILEEILILVPILHFQSTFHLN